MSTFLNTSYITILTILRESPTKMLKIFVK